MQYALTSYQMAKPTQDIRKKIKIPNLNGISKEQIIEQISKLLDSDSKKQQAYLQIVKDLSQNYWERIETLLGMSDEDLSKEVKKETDPIYYQKKKDEIEMTDFSSHFDVNFTDEAIHDIMVEVYAPKTSQIDYKKYLPKELADKTIHKVEQSLQKCGINLLKSKFITVEQFQQYMNNAE